MAIDFEERISDFIPAAGELVEIAPSDGRNMIEMRDGGLLGLSAGGRSTSADGGKTWSEPKPVRDAEGNDLNGMLRHLQHLKSGAIGAFWTPRGEGTRWPGQQAGKFGHSLWFTTSPDEVLTICTTIWPESSSR